MADTEASEPRTFGSPEALAAAGATRPPVDPDLDAAPPEVSLLAELEAELGTPPEPKFLTLVVPERPRYALRFSADIEYEDLVKWRKQCSTGKGPDAKLDEVKLSGLILGHNNVAVLRDGNVLVLNDEDATVRSPTFQAFVRCPFDGPDKAKPAFSALTCLRWLFANDGQLAKAADRLTVEAGYGSDAVELDDDEGEPRPT